ncbi:hypothetical protein Tco_0005686 [Tanacetum coccineum]
MVFVFMHMFAMSPMVPPYHPLLHQQEYLFMMKSRWMFPGDNILKLNTDGSSIGSPGPSSFRGLIRDIKGAWVCITVFSQHHVDGLDLTSNPLLYMMRCFPVTSKKDQMQYWMRTNEPYRFVTSKEFAKAYESFHVGRKIASEVATHQLNSNVADIASCVKASRGLKRQSAESISVDTQGCSILNEGFSFRGRMEQSEQEQV